MQTLFPSEIDHIAEEEAVRQEGVELLMDSILRVDPNTAELRTEYNAFRENLNDAVSEFLGGRFMEDTRNYHEAQRAKEVLEMDALRCFADAVYDDYRDNF